MNVSAYWKSASDHPGIRLFFTGATGKFVQILSKDWIVLCEIEIYGEIYTPIYNNLYNSRCPHNFPFVFSPNNNFSRCCASANDKDGNIGINAHYLKGTRSESCQDDMYTSCSDPPCSDHYTTTSPYGYRSVANEERDCQSCASGQYQNVIGQTICKQCPPGTRRVQNKNQDQQHWNYRWVLLFRQTVLENKNPWDDLYGNGQLSVDPDDPTRSDYSNLGNINDYKNDDGTYHMKILWPMSTTHTGYNEWKQTSNPATSTSVTGYSAIHEDYAGNGWAGLALSGNTNDCLIDGSPGDSSTSYYCLGAYEVGSYPILGPTSDGENQVELWIYTNKFIAIADDSTDCIVCDSGKYQDEEGMTYCKDCPSGTIRQSHTNDLVKWNGVLNVEEDFANEKKDCYVCASGKYQEEHGMTECKNCPAGSIRPVSSGKDGVRWDERGRQEFLFLNTNAGQFLHSVIPCSSWYLPDAHT
jgi:hypothetical protein